MVTVTDYAVRTNSNGDAFVVLVLTGDLQMVQSKETGQFYATAKKCSISSTFSAELAAQMVGKQLPGSIVKQACEPYEFTIPDSGEIVILTHRWVYVQEESDAPVVKAPVVHKPLSSFSSNGTMAMA